MYLIFAVILSLVVVVPLLYRDRLDYGAALIGRLYLSLGIACGGVVVHGLAGLHPAGSPRHWLFEFGGICIGLAAGAFLAATVIHHLRPMPPAADTKPPAPSEDQPSQVQSDPIQPSEPVEDAKPPVSAPIKFPAADESDDTAS